MREKPAHDSLQITHISYFFFGCPRIWVFLPLQSSCLGSTWHVYILCLVIFSSTLILSSSVKETRLNKRKRSSKRRFLFWDLGRIDAVDARVPSSSNVSTCFLNLRNSSRDTYSRNTCVRANLCRAIKKKISDLLNMSHTKFDIFVGTTSGIVKGLKIGRVKKENKIKNLQNVSLITETDKVTRMAWGNNEQEILVACSGYKDNKVKIFDTESAVLKDWFSCNIGTDAISGISQYGSSILTSAKSGEICLWTEGKGELLIKTEQNLNRMCHSREHTNLIATGGEENNNLRVFDLEIQKPIFTAKDLPHDWLCLRRSIPISDISFLPGSLIVTVGKYGNIHLYDLRRQRRPTIDMTVKDEAWTCLDITSKEKHIIVGSTKGKLNLVDLRQSGTVLNTYKGFIGGITGVACSKTNPYVASVSLDRYLRIHHIHTKEFLKSIYLTSKLSSLVMKSDICIEIGYEDGTEN